MNNNILLAYAVRILPVLTLILVGISLLYKLIIKIRSRYSVTVNCWFCNQNSKVPYLEKNSWTCTKCEQYNGFTKDGDYNREILQQFDCSTDLSIGNAPINLNYSNWLGDLTHNGFCDACNEAQRLKVEKLSQFEPKKESRFDEELKIYKAELEKQYRLCATCDRHLKKVLRDKKKMVLGSKFLEFIIKGAESLKKPQYNVMRLAKQQLWKHRLSLLITALTAINVCCLFSTLPGLNRTWFTETLGESLGSKTFIVCSHVVALWRVLRSFLAAFLQHETVAQVGLFVRTIFMMLLYSLGLRLPQIVRLNFLSLYTLAAPFCVLAATFSYNVVDRFKLSRYTFLLVLWSLCTGGLMENNSVLGQSLIFLASFLTCFLTSTSKIAISPKLYDSSSSSFHKICSEVDFSDGDTASSIFSHEFDCTSTLSTSARSNTLRLSPSMEQRKQQSQLFTKKSPLTSSTLSLNGTLRPMQQSHTFNTSLNSGDYSLNNSRLRSQYTGSFCNEQPLLTPSIRHSNLNSFASSPRSEMSFSHQRTVHQQPHENHGFHRQATMTPLPLFSAFSAAPSSSATTLFNPERPSRLLSPSRFSFEALTPQNQQASYAATVAPLQILHEHRGRFGNACNNDNISRASSHSSGFESQNGHLNDSRENSCCAEPNELFKQIKSKEDRSSRIFKPANESFNGSFRNSFRPASLLLSRTPSFTPLSLNCASNWNAAERTHSMPRDSFNFHKINQDLPTIKRGDLLKKWKEGEVIS